MALNANRFYTLPSLSLLSRHMMYPAPVESMLGLGDLIHQQRHSLVNHVPGFLNAAAAFSPQDGVVVDGKSSQHDEDETGTDLSSTAADSQRTGRMLIGDTVPRSWLPFTHSDSTRVADPPSLSDVGMSHVFHMVTPCCECYTCYTCFRSPFTRSSELTRVADLSSAGVLYVLHMCYTMLHSVTTVTSVIRVSRIPRVTRVSGHPSPAAAS